jgi:hypothetical protein
MPPSSFPSEASPTLLFVTTGGAIGVVSRIEKEEDAQILTQVERNMNAVVPPIGNISHEE